MSNLKFTETFKGNLLSTIKHINILKCIVIIGFILLFFNIFTFFIGILSSYGFVKFISRVSDFTKKTREALENDNQDSLEQSAVLLQSAFKNLLFAAFTVTIWLVLWIVIFLVTFYKISQFF